jgi:hypothetical protein
MRRSQRCLSPSVCIRCSGCSRRPPGAHGDQQDPRAERWLGHGRRCMCGQPLGCNRKEGLRHSRCCFTIRMAPGATPVTLCFTAFTLRDITAATPLPFPFARLLPPAPPVASGRPPRRPVPLADPGLRPCWRVAVTRILSARPSAVCARVTFPGSCESNARTTAV